WASWGRRARLCHRLRFRTRINPAGAVHIRHAAGHAGWRPHRPRARVGAERAWWDELHAHSANAGRPHVALSREARPRGDATAVDDSNRAERLAGPLDGRPLVWRG